MIPVLVLSVLTLIVACGNNKEEASGQEARGWLDSAYFSKTYRQAMDSLQQQEPAIEASDLSSLQSFMRDYRDSIQGHPTYGQLLDNAKSLKTIKKSGIGMTVESMNIRKEQKMVEIRFVLKFENKSNLTLDRFSGSLVWLNANKEPICKSPAFTVMGPFKAGDKSESLKLEYAYSKPTGNEMNDPKNAAFRDTLAMMDASYKLKDLSLFDFQFADAQLPGDWALNSYFFRAPEAQQQIAQAQSATKPIQILDWSRQNEVWIQRLQSKDAQYKLAVMPVLTDKTEMGHGKFFIIDRCEKVKAFFTDQKRIPGSHIKCMWPRIPGMRMVFNQRMEYWNWPMEIRIFERLN